MKKQKPEERISLQIRISKDPWRENQRVFFRDTNTSVLKDNYAGPDKAGLEALF